MGSDPFRVMWDFSALSACLIFRDFSHVGFFPLCPEQGVLGCILEGVALVTP